VLVVYPSCHGDPCHSRAVASDDVNEPGRPRGSEATEPSRSPDRRRLPGLARPDASPRGSEATELAGFYRHLVTSEFTGYCDLYARIGAAAAEDAEFLAVVARLAPAPKVVPILLFAAVHDLVLRDPDQELARIYATGAGDPWPPFRALVLDRTAELAATMTRRSIQTNEVGRSVPLAAALTAVHRADGRPLAIVEVGASAGLNLLLDRYAHVLGDHGVIGDPQSAVRLACEVRGPLHPPWGPALPPVARRVGIDLEPVDVLDPGDRRWLEACVWPLVPDRPERLRAALALATADPPDLRRGDGVDLIEAVVAELPADALVCVVFSWSLAYLDHDRRRAMGARLDDIGSRQDLACVTAEYPGIAPWIARPERPPAGAVGEGATLLGVASWHGGRRSARPVAWIHAHGRWIDWLDPASAEM
jgi:hypothetical protein